MIRRFTLAGGLSLVLCCVAAAQPQTVSYYSGTCAAPGSCDIAPSLPPQGFVLTDVICQVGSISLTVQEVSGPNVVDKASFTIGTDYGSPSYHLNSGIPFTGGAGIRTVTSTGSPPPSAKLTLVGYIPNTGCCTSGAPAIGNLGLFVLFTGMLAIGGAVLRRRKLA